MIACGEVFGERACEPKTCPEQPWNSPRATKRVASLPFGTVFPLGWLLGASRGRCIAKGGRYHLRRFPASIIKKGLVARSITLHGSATLMLSTAVDLLMTIILRLEDRLKFCYQGPPGPASKLFFCRVRASVCHGGQKRLAEKIKNKENCWLAA